MSENLRNDTKAVCAFERALKNGLDKSCDTLFETKARPTLVHTPFTL